MCKISDIHEHRIKAQVEAIKRGMDKPVGLMATMDLFRALKQIRDIAAPGFDDTPLTLASTDRIWKIANDAIKDAED